MDSQAGLTIPHDFYPRSYQKRLLRYLASGGKRAVAVWHRRAGKDSTALNFTIWAAYQRVGTYFHVFPLLNQGRKALWDARTREGKPFLDYFPRDIVRRRLDAEMMLELENGSIWQLVGTDNVDRLRGTNPIGVVFSEYATSNPEAWDVIRPILRENGGWAVFVYTPYGMGHGWDMYSQALADPTWFCERLTARDTRRDAEGEDGLPIITEQDLDQERREGMDEALLQQEYFCSFDVGAAEQFIAGDLIQQAYHLAPGVHQWQPVVMGVDPARFGDDRTAVLVRQGNMILDTATYEKQDTMATVDHVLMAMGRYPECRAVFVDGVGVGAGVVDRLRQLRSGVIEINSGEQAMDPTHYVNLRSEMWAKVREWLRTDGCLDARRDQGLATELQGPKYRYDLKNRLVVERKEEMRARGLRSPDLADALCLTFAKPVTHEARGPRGQAPQVPSDWNPLRLEEAYADRHPDHMGWNPLRPPWR
jgi:hypothetical protein